MAITVGHLSGSTDGKAVKIAQTATLGTTIHTATTATDQIDRVWIYCVNSDTTAIKLTLEWGEATSPDGLIEMTIPPEAGPYLVVEGFPLQNGLVITAFAATADMLMIHGYVLRSSTIEAFN